MSEMLSKCLRWGGGGSFFLEGGSRKGGFVRTPRTPSGYGPAVLDQHRNKNGKRAKVKRAKLASRQSETRRTGTASK